MKQKYKVFLNDRVINFCSRENITINQSSVSFDDRLRNDELVIWFNMFEAGNMKEAYLVHPDPELLFNRFRESFLFVKAAGGVVVSDNKLLVIFRRGKWDLPKGKLDGDETAEEGALREVEEETGIRPAGIDHQLMSTYHLYKSPYPGSQGEWIFKETVWFQMSYSGELTGNPQLEEDITDIKWVSRNNLEVITGNTYPNLMQVIDLYRD